MTIDDLKAKGYVETAQGVWTMPMKGRLVSGGKEVEYAAKIPQPEPGQLRPDPDTTTLVGKAKVSKPLLNVSETRVCDHLIKLGYSPVYKQAFTLRLDPPFKSYTPDLAYHETDHWRLVFVEVKGKHRFREKGIAKAALAAKTYPQFRFVLFDIDGKEWKETVLSP